MKFFEQLEGLVNGQLSVIKTLIDLIQLETRLAGLSVYPLLVNLCGLLIVLMTVWSLGMILLGYWFAFVFGHVIWSVLLLLLINMGLLFSLLYYLLFNLKKMSFEKTRRYFSKKESPDYANLESKAE